MGELTNAEIKQKMSEALDEPNVSEEFVETMVVRANAITNGREAEKLLSEGGLTQSKKIELAAESVVGRMMINTKPPKGVSASAMTKQLSSVPKFREEVEKSGDELVHELKNGDFIKKFGVSPSIDEKRSPERPLEKTMPDDPAVEIPTAKRPGLSI